MESKELQTTSLMYATEAGSLSSIQRYLMAGVDLGQCNYDRRTPLHVAAAEGHYDVVEFLLTKAKVPTSPLDRYCEWRDHFIEANLISFFCFRWSRTPLDEAQAFGHDSVVKLLQQNGAQNGTDHQHFR